MNFFKTLPLLAALVFGGVLTLPSGDAQAQQIVRESRQGGKRVHKQANNKKTNKKTSKKQGTRTTTTVTTTTNGRRDRTSTVRTREVRPSRTVHNRHTVVHSHAPYRTRYAHPRHHYSYRYVYWPRYQTVHYVDRPSVVYVETQADPELPEVDCPIYTESITTSYETYCSTDRGTRHGPFVRYHENGEVAEEGMYEYGTKEGVWIQYHTNGVMKSEGNYHNGDKEGSWVVFDRDGEEMSRTIYR